MLFSGIGRASSDVNFTKQQTKRWLAQLDRRAASASIMCETVDGRLLIIKANYKEHWTVPGGIIDPGESPVQGALREAEEEVGLVFAAEDLEFQYVAHRASDIALTYQFVFKTRLDDEQIAQIKLQAAEIDECALVTRQDVEQNGRFYGKVIRNWANGFRGYSEQQMERGD